MRKYYVKLAGSTVLQSMMYDGPAELTGYTEVGEHTYTQIVDNAKIYTYENGALTSADRPPFILD